MVIKSSEIKNILIREIDMIKKLGEDKCDEKILESVRQLENQMIEPVKRDFVMGDTYKAASSTEEITKKFWVVLEDELSGYRIVFDKEKYLFGLALHGSDNIERYIGVNGNLLYVYDAM